MRHVIFLFFEAFPDTFEDIRDDFVEIKALVLALFHEYPRIEPAQSVLCSHESIGTVTYLFVYDCCLVAQYVVNDFIHAFTGES